MLCMCDVLAMMLENLSCGLGLLERHRACNMSSVRMLCPCRLEIAGRRRLYFHASVVVVSSQPKILCFVLLCTQGLWHPARKVREVYWRHYNNLYVGAQDAMVAFFPRLADDAPNNIYQRHELDMMI